MPQSQHNCGRLLGTRVNGCVWYRDLHPNHVLSYDFLRERTEDGRQLWIRAVIDAFTKECLAIELGRSFIARNVSITLQYLFAARGVREHLRSDKGAVFGAKRIGEWLARAFFSGQDYAPPFDTPHGLFSNFLMSTGTATGKGLP